MKKTFPSLLLIIILIFATNSCSVEKRIYNKGYHVSWNKKLKTNNSSIVDKSDLAENELEIEENVINHNENLYFDQDFVSKNEDHVISFPLKQNNALVEFDIIKEQNLKSNDVNSQSIRKLINETKNAKNSYKKSNNTELSADKKESSGGKALTIIGWILLIIGVVLLLLVSILIGVIVGLFGLLLIIGGASMKNGGSKTNKKTQQTEYVDVVYLKNGSIIKGLIIEQIPNDQLKIQTRDGNVFVYKFDEIQKIAKEENNL